jgi:integrase
MQVGLRGQPSLRKDKKWVQNLYLADGKRVQVYGDTAADVVARAEARLAVSHNPVLAERKTELTVGEYVDAYIDVSARGRDGERALTHETIRSYRLYANNYIKPAIGSIPIRELKRHHVEKMRDDMIAAGGNRSTMNKPLTLLNMVINYAVRAEIIPANLCKGVRVAQDWSERQDHMEERVPTLTEMRALEAAARASYGASDPMVSKAYRRYYPLFLILRSTGMRFSECVGLQWDDFDANWEKVNIRRKVSVPKEGLSQEDRIGRNKSKHSRRTVPLPPDLGPILETWKKECTPTPEGWVFPTKRGTVLNYHNAREKFWLPLLRRAGVTGLTLHGLRHFYASTLMRKGLAKQASQYLGHSSVAFTMDVYGHLLPDDKEMMDAVRDTVLAGMEV